MCTLLHKGDVVKFYIIIIIIDKRTCTHRYGMCSSPIAARGTLLMQEELAWNVEIQ